MAKNSPDLNQNTTGFLGSILDQMMMETLTRILKSQGLQLVRDTVKRGYSKHQAATYLGCSTRTIDRLHRRGHLPAKKLGKKTLFDKRDLDAYWDAIPDSRGVKTDDGTPQTQGSLALPVHRIERKAANPEFGDGPPKRRRVCVPR